MFLKRSASCHIFPISERSILAIISCLSFKLALLKNAELKSKLKATITCHMLGSSIKNVIQFH